MNILLTGASRGIGAAAFALLKSAGHHVAGHSTRGSDELLAGDLADPAAPRGSGTRRSTGSAGGSTCSSTMPASTKPSPTMRRRRLARAWAAHADRSTSRPPPTSAASPSRISERERRRPHRQRRQPRRLPRRFARALALCRVQGGDDRHDQDASPAAMRREDILAFAVAPGLHRLGNDRGISRRPRRRGRSSPTSRSAASPAPTRSPRRSAGWRPTRPPPRPASVIDVNGASYVR